MPPPGPTADRPGRVRFREPQAQLYWSLLWDYYGIVINRRWQAKQRNAALTSYQRELAMIDAMKAELMRTAEEMGWDLFDGKPEQPDAQGPGPVDAAAERERLD